MSHPDADVGRRDGAPTRRVPTPQPPTQRPLAHIRFLRQCYGQRRGDVIAVLNVDNEEGTLETNGSTGWVWQELIRRRSTSSAQRPVGL